MSDRAFKLATSSTADKLPLEKFHRLLDLVFWRERQKIFDFCYTFKNSYTSLPISFLLLFFIFFLVFIQGITGYYSDPVACGAYILGVAAGGADHSPAPPGPRFHQSLSSVSSVSSVSRLLLSTGKGTP